MVQPIHLLRLMSAFACALAGVPDQPPAPLPLPDRLPPRRSWPRLESTPVKWGWECECGAKVYPEERKWRGLSRKAFLLATGWKEDGDNKYCESCWRKKNA